MATSESSKPVVYGNWRPPASAGLFGLGMLSTGFLLIMLAMLVFMVMVAGLFVGLVGGTMLVVFVLLFSIRDRHGRNVFTRAGTRMGWMQAHLAGSHLYSSGPLGRTPWGTNQLPGLAAPTRLSEHRDSYGRPFALLYVPFTGHYTVVLTSNPDGAALVDREQVDQWVAGWAQWLGSLSQEPGLEGAQVTIETAPDPGHRLRREVSGNTDPNAPDVARKMLEEIARTYPNGSSVVRAYICLTFRAIGAAGKRRKVEEVAQDLTARLPSLTGSLAATGAGAARPMSAAELCEVVRVAYDPADAQLIDELRSKNQESDLLWSEVGPESAQAAWDSYRHDSGHSVTWSMSRAPRGLVQSSVLRRLLEPHSDIARKRITLFFRPLDPALAAAVVENDLRATQFRTTSNRQPRARDKLATAQASATANEEARGASLLNFAVSVTATVLDAKDLPAARAAIDNLSATARLQMRPAYGKQDAAFVAGLPLGLVIPRHLRLPVEFREKL